MGTTYDLSDFFPFFLRLFASSCIMSSFRLFLICVVFLRLWCFEVIASNQYMYQYPFSRHFISPSFLFSVSFPYWAKLRIIIGREKVPSSLLFWPKNDRRETNLLPCGQTVLATVWKVLSRYGTCQNLRKNCASNSTSFCSIWCMWTILSVQWSSNNFNYTPH